MSAHNTSFFSLPFIVCPHENRCRRFFYRHFLQKLLRFWKYFFSDGPIKHNETTLFRRKKIRNCKCIYTMLTLHEFDQKKCDLLILNTYYYYIIIIYNIETLTILNNSKKPTFTKQIKCISIMCVAI